MSKKKLKFDEKYYKNHYEDRAWLKGDKPFQHRFWIRYLRKLKPTGKLLDAGCGNGYFLKYAEKNYETYGVDISDYAVKKAKKRAKKSKIEAGNMAQLGFEDEYFDIVTAFDVLEHTMHPLDAIREIHRILKIGGVMVVSVPNLNSIGRVWKKDYWYGYKDKTHVSLLPGDEWIKTLQENGFEILDKFYDGLWDSPYWDGIPSFVQHLTFKIPATILFGLGFKFSEKYGENLCLLATKLDKTSQ